MNIRMYNCYFGDCFRIMHDDSNDLLVDFGIHPSRFKNKKTNTKMTKRFNDIRNDLADVEMDFLLSHYHEDHYNGVLKLIHKFDNVYIPDIWRFNNAIELVLLRQTLEKCLLNKKITIYDFLITICKNNHCMIHYVQRGSSIQGDKYIALWPSSDCIKTLAEKALEKAIKTAKLNENEQNTLRRIANDTSDVVSQLYSRNSNEDQHNRLIDRLSSLQNELDEFANSLGNRADKANDKFNKVIGDLRVFENKISIVFQNKDDDASSNLLFTGDFGKSATYWKVMETNSDNVVDMHSIYHVIKVPHHGTRSYYHSFTPRMNNESIFMIPNGDELGSWNICSDYSLNTNNLKSKAICSTDFSCEARNNNKNKTGIMACPCANRIIIENSGSFYVDIT